MIKKLFLIIILSALNGFSKNANKLISSNSESLKIITWNIQDLGQSKNDTEIDFIVKVLNDFDIIALQEVVAKHPAGAQKVAQIVDALNRKGFKWDYRISDPTNSPSVYMSERYAFIWKTSKVKMLTRAYLDKELEDYCIREPFIGKFQSKRNSAPFYVVNFHSRTHSDKPELEIIYFQNYQKRLQTDNILIVGDFNLSENHNVWDSLYQQGYKSALKNSKTTLKQKCKRGDYLSHAIDNVYYSKGVKFSNAGVIDYLETCENLKAARMISDHLPVFLEFSITDN
jgi:endonuclease/exonuclease/phosphatase family metal-dependent hydrolase